MICGCLLWLLVSEEQDYWSVLLQGLDLFDFALISRPHLLITISCYAELILRKKIIKIKTYEFAQRVCVS
jgi:hypothetical protein